MSRFVSEFSVQPHKITSDESGQAMAFYDHLVNRHMIFGDGCFFVRLHSWDVKKMHPMFKSLLGHKIRIVVETVDEETSPQTTNQEAGL